MNVLEQLRDDMEMAGGEAEGCGENVLDACIAILDEFSAGHKVVEVFDVRHTGEPADHWLAMPDSTQHEPDFVWGDKEVVTPLTIIVPRKQEQTLLEAAEGAHRWLQCFCRSQGEPGVTAEGARDALAKAIKEERER